MVSAQRRPREESGTLQSTALDVGTETVQRGGAPGNETLHTNFKHVLLEIVPAPASNARLTFKNLSTSQPRLEVEDEMGSLEYTGVYEDLMGSVLVFKETKVTTAGVRERLENEGEGTDGMDVDGGSLHGMLVARLEAQQAAAEGNASAGGSSGAVVPTVTVQGQALQGSGGGRGKKGSDVRTVTEMEGVANVKLVFRR